MIMTKFVKNNKISKWGNNDFDNKKIYYGKGPYDQKAMYHFQSTHTSEKGEKIINNTEVTRGKFGDKKYQVFSQSFRKNPDGTYHFLRSNISHGDNVTDIQKQIRRRRSVKGFHGKDFYSKLQETMDHSARIAKGGSRKAKFGSSGG